MDFSLSEDQIMIRDAARDYLSQASDSAAVRAAMASDSGFDPEVWQQIAAELGFCAIPVPEAQGGLGLGPVELALVLEQMGEHLLCAPFFATVGLAANVLAECADEAARQRFLPQIAAGEITATVPLPSDGGAWSSRGLRARATADGWVVDGECPRVPNGDVADWVFVFADIEGESEPGLFAVAADSFSAQPLQTIDATRRFARVAFAEAAALRCGQPDQIVDGRRRAVALARLAIAAEAVGAAQRCLDLTVAYTSERKQFGRPVGGFQAVKHRCAEMMVRTEAARSAVLGAAAVAAGEPDTDALARECAMARVVADAAAFYGAAQAIQLHGGVGFTWEYDPQLYFKRAQASRHWLGDTDAVRAEIAADLMSA